MESVNTSAGQPSSPDAALRVDKTRVANMDHADAQLAAEFGYKPVLKREFGYFSTFSFAVSISGLFATVMTTMIYPLEAGGSSAVVWCWLISGIGCMCLACSVAELVSALPTAGGLYFTISRLAPQEWVSSICWLDGWLNILGQICGVASSEYGAAQMLLAAVSMARDFDYEITTGTTVGVMAALTITTGLINSLPTSWIEKITKFYVIFHVLILVSCSIALLVKTENKHDATYVFTHVESTSGWHPLGFSFLFGFLSVSWCMTDYDASSHLAEEIKSPELMAPWAISSAMLFTYLAGFLFNIVLCFCMGDPSAILSSPTQQPVAQLFYNSLGKVGGIFYTVSALLIIKFVTWTALQALARTVFACARDRMLPFSNAWTKISPLTGTPLNAVWISTFFCIAINLIALGSYTAISAVFTLCSIALDWSYCIPVLCKLLFGKFKPGPWHMGRLSPFVNAWACLWTLFVSIIFVLPTARPVTAENMNYACVFLVFVLLFALVYWYISGKKFYRGPVSEAVVDDSLSESNSQVKADKMGTRV
ncbi:amino acid transporter [Aspergillus saccharolyticus JOP 1030-1]|uniref:Amino acid transporter n=1 Tax=Aspergillus saccharolyticus JOP 1030-1 TaxID=1450539 RepID=A0A319ACE8_9EURO|nr:amino acid transporter [Aspergillus saccharolyticus JOP 1030-1]PYH44572.1 amino acid transporter [Aspergillus saccharolyticus JOP 1030-1]